MTKRKLLGHPAVYDAEIANRYSVPFHAAAGAAGVAAVRIGHNANGSIGVQPAEHLLNGSPDLAIILGSNDRDASCFPHFPCRIDRERCPGFEEFRAQRADG